MAILTFILVSLMALLTLFLSTSPVEFHGLVPWMDSLSNLPFIPTPSASAEAVSPPSFWEKIPVAQVDVCFRPAPTLPLCFHEEDDQQPLFVSPREEPTWEELLRGLWSVSREALLLLAIYNIIDFVSKYPYLRSERSGRRLRPVKRPTPRHSRSRSRGRFFPSLFLSTYLTQSKEKDNRIAALEATVSELSARMKELENLMAVQSQTLMAESPRGMENDVSQADASSNEPVSVPTSPVEELAAVEPAAAGSSDSFDEPVSVPLSPIEEPAIAAGWSDDSSSDDDSSDETDSVPLSPIEVPAIVEPAAGSRDKSIFYDAKMKGIHDPNPPTDFHLIFIQNLIDAGYPTKVIVRSVMKMLPDVHRGRGRGTKKDRKRGVKITVNLKISRWAPRTI